MRFKCELPNAFGQKPFWMWMKLVTRIFAVVIIPGQKNLLKICTWNGIKHSCRGLLAAIIDM